MTENNKLDLTPYNGIKTNIVKLTSYDHSWKLLLVIHDTDYWGVGDIVDHIGIHNIKFK